MLKEDFIFNTYDQTNAFNNTWKVIYNEAIRNNHILFDNIEEIRTRPLINAKEGSLEVEKIAEQLIFNSNLTNMKKQINKLKLDQQVMLFALYKSLIEHIKQQTIRSFN